MKIAFIGLGHMGGPMALNLRKAGFAVKAFDLSSEACKKYAAEGLAIAASAAESVADADVVISMLPASAHVEGLFLGSGGSKPGLLDSIRAGTLVIDSSTIAAATSRKVAEAA
ncbi:MAG TPA: NAD(P)-binding domain-containing protein, partial [Variovorax sp.]|nr:NAD(P)-binding domain-containing protein [Variovorax sp.]